MSPARGRPHSPSTAGPEIRSAAHMRAASRTVPDLTMGVRAALDAAMEAGGRVAELLRGDASKAHASRLVEGVPTGYRAARDGCVRVVFAVAEEAAQTVLIERIVGIVPLQRA